MNQWVETMAVKGRNGHTGNGAVLKTVMSAGLFLALGGCTTATFKDTGVGPLVTPNQSNSGMDVVNALRDSVTKGSDKVNDPLIKDACFAVTADDNSECQAGRNRAVAALRIASDDLCQDHIRGIYGKETSANIITGSGAVLASGWATVSGSASAKTALAAISTFFSAERSLINEVYFKTQVSTAVTSKIRQGRAEKAAQLDQKYAKSIIEYPVLQALGDVVSYHYTCSFVLGLEKALAEGQGSSDEIKHSKLTQERQQLLTTLDIHKANSNLSTEGDDGIKARIKAIDAELQRLSIGVVAPAQAQASGQAEAGTPSANKQNK